MFKKKNTIDRTNDLQIEAGNILDVFSKTANDLDEVNAKLEIEKTILEEEAAVISNALNSLSATRGYNTKIANKIREFLK